VNAKSKRPAGIAFLVLGIGLTAMGMSGQRAFAGVGVVFLVIGIAFLARSKSAGAGN
jgi:membrane-bound ClpP family serine protease